ncbi:MAG: hypothetical protein JXA72_14340, partial [Bacteroidales bacterium]|nr:hypothetical protein [Bacteroidales bacterium]
KFAIESLYYKDIFSQNIPVIEYQCITDFTLTAMPLRLRLAATAEQGQRACLPCLPAGRR